MVRPVVATALLLFGAATGSLAHSHSGGEGASGHDAIVVESVVPGSPAEAAGLQAGDSLVQLGGQEIEGWEKMQEIMAAHRPGDTVPLIVRREGEPVELNLTFGERPDGGVSIGVRLQVATSQGADGSGDPEEGTVQCLTWIEQTYRIESLMGGLDLELSDTYEEMRTCVGRDTRRMGSTNAVKYCDNIFKVHCSGLDLLTEIGEAQVRRCEEQLSDSLGLKPAQHKGWKTCAQHEVFDRYTLNGGESDAEACRALLLDECGTNIDTTVQTAQVSAEQRSFVDCCSADAVGGQGGSAKSCRMIDDGFTRGPCHDQPVCVNRLTSEWIHCSAIE